MQDVLDLMARASRAVEFPDALRGRGPRPPEIGYIEVWSLALHDRCHSLHSASHLLLSNGFVHEAAILGRPMFSASLTLAELAAADVNQRGSLLFGISFDGLARQEEYLRAREELDHDVTAERQRLVDAKKGDEAMARELGVSSAPHRKLDWDLKGRAAKYGRSSEYGALLIAQQFIHGASGVIGDRIGREGDTVVIGGHVARSKPWVRDFGLFATFSVLHAGVAICTILGLPQPPELNRLMHEVAGSTEAARRARQTQPPST